MKFDELLSKHKKEIKIEFDKYNGMGSVELDEKTLVDYKYRRVIFGFRKDMKLYRVKTLDDVDELYGLMRKYIRELGVPYYNVKPDISMNHITLSGYALVRSIDKFADYQNNQYYFADHFTEIIRIETGIQYLNKIECAVIKMYREDIITYEQLIKAVTKC